MCGNKKKKLLILLVDPQAGGRGRGREHMRGGGGRGGRGGHGGGRGATGQFGGYTPAPAQQYAPFGGYQQGGYQSGGQQSGQIPGGGYGGYQPPQSFSNTKKRFNNMNYCWTHGGDIHHEHASAMCGNPMRVTSGMQQGITSWEERLKTCTKCGRDDG